jgi:putative transposase
MPRTARQCPAGFVYHVWNRAAGRLRLFRKDADYLAFERILLEAHQRHPIKLLEWCLMPNHWHFVVAPDQDNQTTDFFRWLTHTHAMRSIAHRRVMGMGPLYQGRFKSLPVQEDEHLLTLLRYVQRNPFRAGLVSDAREWRWGTQWIRRKGPAEMRAIVTPWPLDPPPNWTRYVNEPQTEAELEAIRQTIRRSRPFGDRAWIAKTSDQLQLGWTLRARGRPPRNGAQIEDKELRPL